jgi:hypothetical protein
MRHDTRCSRRGFPASTSIRDNLAVRVERRRDATVAAKQNNDGKRVISQPKLIVLEKNGWLARALRRSVGGSRTIVETRSMKQLFDDLDDAPTSVVTIDGATIQPDRLIACCFRVGREFPLAATTVVLPRSYRDVQWEVREAGAIHVCIGPRRLAPMTTMIERRLQRSPQLELTLAERILASMPLSGGR